MSHGAPDYSNVTKGVSVFRLDDMGELAVRLFSPVVWDRRGDVFFMDNFMYGLESWDKLDGGGDEDYYLSASRPDSGPYCAYLQTQSGGGGFVLFYKGFPPTTSPNIGFETHIKPLNYFGYFDTYFNWYTGTEKRQYYIRLDAVEKTIEYKNSGGAFVAIIEDLDLSPSIARYHFIKWVVDVENDNFLWLRFNEQTYIFDEEGGYITADSEPPNLVANILFYDNGIGQGTARLDTIILTQDEQ